MYIIADNIVRRFIGCGQFRASQLNSKCFTFSRPSGHINFNIHSALCPPSHSLWTPLTSIAYIAEEPHYSLDCYQRTNLDQILTIILTIL